MPDEGKPQEFEGLVDFLSGMDQARPDGPRERTTHLRQMGWDEALFKKWIVEAFQIEDKETNAMAIFGPLLMNHKPQAELLWRIMRALRRGGQVRMLILKSRKLGVSTVLELLLLAIAMCCHKITCGIIAHTDQSSAKLFSIARTAYEHLPPEIRRKFPLRQNNLGLLQFGNKNEHIELQGLGHLATVKSTTAAGAYPFAGDTVRVLHLSECALYDAVGDYDAQQRFILSAIGSVPKVGPSVVIAESTANGQQGWFYDEWMRATAGKGDSGWEPIFFSWLEDPACYMAVPRDYDWSRWDPDDKETERELREDFRAKPEQLFFRRWTISTSMGGSYEWFDQEFPTTPSGAFIASGRPAIPRRYIKAMEASVNDDYVCYMTRVVDGYANTLTYSVDGEIAE